MRPIPGSFGEYLIGGGNVPPGFEVGFERDADLLRGQLSGCLRDGSAMDTLRKVLYDDNLTVDARQLSDVEVLDRICTLVAGGWLQLARPNIPQPVRGGGGKGEGKNFPPLPPPPPPPPPPPKKWKLFVTVTSIVKGYWPSVDVKVLLTGIKGTGGTKEKMVKHTEANAPAAKWEGGAVEHYSCTAEVTKGKRWELVAPKEVDLFPGDVKDVVLEIRLKPAFVKLVWLDPEDKERVFPKGYPVTIAFDEGGTLEATVGEKGVLSFPATGAQKKFTLTFKKPGQYIASEPDKDPSPTTELLKSEGDLPKLLEDKWRYFMTPPDWEMRRSDWKVTDLGATAFDAATAKFTITDDEIGTEAKPIHCSLDPHWQFVRFEFFDRFHGHDDHAHKRISVPALCIDGISERATPETRGAHASPDSRSNWTFKPTSNDDMCHVLPWVVQKKPDFSEHKKPDDKILLQIVTAANTYVHCTDATTRVVEVAPAADKLKASADRLKYYDLPALWKSANYYTRLVGEAEGKIFESVPLGKIQASETHAGRLTFSLDDIVLTDATFKKIKLADEVPEVPAAGATPAVPKIPADRVTVFYHKFLQAAEAGKTSKIGIYKCDDGNKESFHSKVDREDYLHSHTYLTDYPNWVRVLAAQGSLFDNFDQRTVDADPNDVVGARAAVRWVDAPAVGKPAGQIMAARPPRVDHPYFSVQPLAEQLYSQTNLKYTGRNNPNVQDIGRVDMAVLRCCGRNGDVEEIVNMHYFKFMYNFGKVPVITMGAVSGVGADTATLNWTTDVKTNTRVDFGTTAAYTDNYLSDEDASVTLNHSAPLTGLTADTTYHYQITAMDASGNTSVMKDFVFKTTGPGAAPAAPAVTTTNTPGAFLSNEGKRKDFAEGNSTNVACRLTGHDAVSTVRAELIPLDAAANKLHGQVVYFIQPVYTLQRATFSVQVVVGGGRNWMWGLYGTGEMGEKGTAPEGEYGQPQAYTAAHETGHADGLPDEYSERWSAASFNESSNRYNTPGDAYEDDGVVWDDFASSPVDAALMTGVVEMRNRYYWHSAEFARAATNVPFKVKLGAFAEYKLPHHEAAPNRSYVYWPIEDAIDFAHQFIETREFEFTTGDGSLPAISSVSVVPTNNRVMIAWTTDRATDSSIEWGLTTAYGHTDGVEPDLSTNHAVSFSGMSQGKVHHYRIKVKDENGLVTTSADATFTATAAAGPTITGATANTVTAASAQIALNTSDDATVTVDYGLTTAYGSSAAGPLGKVHAVALAGLTAGRQYHYRIRATDAAGNVSFASDRTFTTTDAAKPVVSDLEVIPVSGTSVRFRYKSSRPCSDYVQTKIDGGTAVDSPEVAGERLDHDHTVNGLTPGALYTFFAIAKDPAGVLGFLKGSFSTCDGTPPVVSKNTGTSVELKWSTASAMGSQVEYGIGGYGQHSAPAAAHVTDHTVKLTGLTASTTYKARVKSPTATGAGIKDIMVYPAGEEKYTKTGLDAAKGTFDGILIIAVKLRVTLPQVTSDPKVRAFLKLMRSSAKLAFNKKFYATGKVRSGSAQEWTFAKCFVKFSPRFLVVNRTPAATITNEMTNVGVHYDVVVRDTPSKSFGIVAGSSRGELSIGVNLAGATADVEIKEAFREGFARMIGLVDVAGATAANVKPIFAHVVTSGADAHDF